MSARKFSSLLFLFAYFSALPSLQCIYLIFILVSHYFFVRLQFYVSLLQKGKKKNNYDIYGIGDHYQPSVLLASVLQTIRRYDALLVHM